MKKSLLLAALAVAASAALSHAVEAYLPHEARPAEAAATPLIDKLEASTFIGNANWRKSSGPGDRLARFGQLEQMGIEHAAEKDGISKCLEKGFALCYAVSAQITSCNEQEDMYSKHCRARAVVRGENR